MSTVLLTHSYFLRFDQKQWQTAQPYPPLGTLYAAAILRDSGHKVAVFDTMFARSAADIKAPIDEHHPRYFVIFDDGFNYLTKMCLTNMREAAFGMCALAKESGCIVIISSSDSTDRYAEYLVKGADYVLLGEADDTLPELIAAIENGTAVNGIAGLAYSDQQIVTRTNRRNVIRELDRIPFPAHDLIDIAAYRNMWLKSSGYFSLNMSTTRGCPFKCNWCAKPIYGNHYNSRSPDNVVQELLKLQNLYQFDHIWFCDDIFGLKPGWIAEFARLVTASGLKLRFKIQSRADLLVHSDTVKNLAAAGCENVWIGAESGSQRILDAMDKGTTIEQIALSTSLLKEHGVLPSFFIQFGYPGENKQDIALTIQMINKLLPHEIGISVSYPLPGTVFFDRVKANMQEKTNWTDSNEMVLMFQNTYTPAFYKQLHQYVHRNYHKSIAMQHVAQLVKAPWNTNLRKLKKAISALYYTPAVWVDRFKLNRAEKQLA